jgi:hypothetical protein
MLHLLLITTALATCPNYTCVSTPGSLCNLSVNNTIFIKSCEDDRVCVQANGTYSCQRQTLDVYPGEYCDAYNVCVTSCANNLCVGLKEGDKCTATELCAPGLACLERVCRALLKVGASGCKVDSDCDYGLACDVRGECIRVFSLDDYSIVSCPRSWSTVCKSNFCMSHYCITPQLDLNPIPINCTAPAECLKYNHLIYDSVSCDCTYANDDLMTCATPANKWPVTKLSELKRSWLLNPAIVRCNSARRLKESCVSLAADEQFAEEFRYYKAYTQLFHRLYASEGCVFEFFMPTNHTDNDEHHSDMATFLTFSALVAFVL